MITEKKWLGVAPVPMTASGTTKGLVTVASIKGFFVKQIVNIKSSTQPSVQVVINRFLSDTQFFVGPVKGKIEDRADISAYLLANSPTVEAAEQSRSTITEVEHNRAVYAEEPIVAKRSILVDDTGNYYNSSNPMPVSFSGGVSVAVKLTHLDNYPNLGDIADSTRIGDGANTVKMVPSADSSKVGMSTVRINAIFSKPYSRLRVTSKNDDGDPLVIESMFGATVVQTGTITYDADGDFQDITVVG